MSFSSILPAKLRSPIPNIFISNTRNNDTSPTRVKNNMDGIKAPPNTITTPINGAENELLLKQTPTKQSGIKFENQKPAGEDPIEKAIDKLNEHSSKQIVNSSALKQDDATKVLDNDELAEHWKCCTINDTSLLPVSRINL